MGISHKNRPKDERNRIYRGPNCTDCDKICYGSKKDAKEAARQMGKLTELHPYRCPHNTRTDGAAWWHIGHLPNKVRKGYVPRDVLKEPREESRV